MDLGVGGFFNDFKRVVCAKFRNRCEDKGTDYSRSTSASTKGYSQHVQGEPFHYFQGGVHKNKIQRQDTNRSMSISAVDAKQLLSATSRAASIATRATTSQIATLKYKEDIQEVPLWNDAPRASAPLLNSGGEIAMAKYGSTPCLALFLSPNVISYVANVVEAKREFGPIEEEYEELSDEIRRSQRFLDQSAKFLEDAANEQRRQELKEMLQLRQEDLDKCLQRKQELEEDYQWQKGQYRRADSSLIIQLAALFRDQGLILPEEQYPDPAGDQTMVDAADPSGHLDQNDHLQASEEDAQRDAEWAAQDKARDRWYIARAALQRAEEDLEERDVVEQNMFRAYLQRIDAGESESVAGCPKEGWGLFPYVLGSKLTRALIDADQEYKQATAHCRAIFGGLPPGAPTDLTSNFPDHPYDGDILSGEEEEARGAVAPEEIQCWMGMTPDTLDPAEIEEIITSHPLAQWSSAITEGNPGTSASTPIIIEDSDDSVKLESEVSELMEVDEWDIPSLAFGEGISATCPLNGPRHEKIAKWHAKCEEEFRPQFAHQIQRDQVLALEYSK